MYSKDITGENEGVESWRKLSHNEQTHISVYRVRKEKIIENHLELPY